MIRCNNCGNLNFESSESCDHCGAKLPTLDSASSASPDLAEKNGHPVGLWDEATAALPSLNGLDLSPKPSGLNERPVEDIAKAPAGKTLDMPQPAGGIAAASNPDRKKKAHAKLIITRGSSVGTEFSLVEKESTIGRWDADNGVFPDIDLDRYDAEYKISRRHARIILDSDQYMVEDLGSTNGTFINRGRRLIPGSRHPLHNGDELILGKTFLKFVIEK